MSLFAMLDENNIVENVIVVADHDVIANGGHQSETAAQWVANKFGKNHPGKTWVEGSEDGSFRNHVPSKGGTYLPEENVFRNVKYYPSWVWNSSIADWESPIGAKPTENKWPAETGWVFWSEPKGTWVAHVITQQEDITIVDGHITAVNTPGIYELRDWDNTAQAFNATGTSVTRHYDF